jgi:hypothetical protein
LLPSNESCLEERLTAAVQYWWPRWQSTPSAGPGRRKEIEVGHAVHIRDNDQYIQALRVLDKVGGTWQGVGTSADPVLLLTDAQYNALLEAGVVSAIDKEVKARGKKAAAKRTKP